MMYLEAIVLGVIIGIIRKGRMSRLFETEFRGMILVVLGIFLHILPIILNKFFSDISVLRYLSFAGICLILVAAILNMKKMGFKLIILGGIVNIIPVIINSFKMPISGKALNISGLTSLSNSISEGVVVNYINADNAVGWTKFLGKIIPIPDFYPLAKVLSMGDIIMAIGIVVFIQHEMVNYHFRKKGNVIRYSYKGYS